MTRWLVLLAGLAALTLLAVAAGTVEAASAGPLGTGLRIAATVPVASSFRTLGVASGDGAVWAAGGGAIVTRVDPRSHAAAATIPVHDAALVVTGAGTVWAIGTDSFASRIDPATNQVAARVPVADYPTGATIGGGSLWVAGRLSSTITRVSLATNKVAKRISTPEHARDLAAGAGAVWAISNDSPKLWRIDPVRNKVVATIPLTDTPDGIVTTPGAVWVLGETNNRVVRIDPKTNKVKGFTVIPKSDGYITFGIAADAHSVWVTTYTHLLRIDPHTGRILAALAIGKHPRNDPVGLTDVSSGPAGVWVGDGDGKSIVQILPS